MKSVNQPEWLRQITYGFSEHNQTVLIDGKHCAVVKSPGGFWSDNGGRHYGPVTYTLVRKDARAAVGLLDGRELQSGGRVKADSIVRWKQLVEECDSSFPSDRT